jgi:Type II secretion system (T2SS), protein N
MSIRHWQFLFFLVAVIGFGVAFAPASLIAPKRENGFTYAHADGTIWDARFDHARLGPLDVGALSWRVELGALLQGKFVADLDASGGALVGKATLLANWRGDRRVMAQSVKLQGAPLSPTVTLAGETTITGLDLYFEKGACKNAQGAVQSDVLARNPDVLRWNGPPLGGQARCDGEDALVALTGATAADSVQTSLKLHANGAGAWRAEVRSANTTAQAALAAAGFALSGPPGGAVMVKEITWAGLL